MPGDPLLLHARSLRQAYDDVDWAATSLGPTMSWSPALRGAVDLVLGTRFAASLFWGPDLVMVYNEAYAAIVPGKHPRALGRPAQEMFPEAWELIGPLMQGVLDGGPSVWIEDALVPLERHGVLRESYFTFSYSAVRDGAGTIEGIIDIVADSTGQVLDRRRLALLRRLTAELADLEHAGELAACAQSVLRDDPADLAAVDLRLAGDGDGDPRLPDAPRVPLGGRDLLVEQTPQGDIAWLALGPAQHSGQRPLLVVLLSELLAVDGAYLDFLRLLASAIGQAVDRVATREAERGISEALQRSLLTTPPAVEGLDLAVRYQPAARRAQIGGDWYDAFVLPDGALTVVVGDVSGHDREAAAAMAQVRNMLRGVAFTLQEPPAAVLAGLEQAMHGLAVEAFATAVLAQVESETSGGHRMRFSNAGHPPPVYLGADGHARLLTTPPDVLLGLRAPHRTDHDFSLAPGASLVLYTDGLVERRGVPLDASLAWLTGVLEGRQDLGAEALCDHVIGQLLERVEDDIALLVLRSCP